MSAPNPYESPTVAEQQVLAAGRLTLARGIGFVLVCMALFAALGASLGLVIGSISPQYYARLFNLPPGGQALAAGALLGLVQGGGVGIAVGIAVYAITAWLQVRLQMIAALRDK